MAQTWSDLEHFFRESFSEGQMCRELRLSPEEQRYLQDKYPRLTWLPQGELVYGKAWYQVGLPGGHALSSL